MSVTQAVDTGEKMEGVVKSDPDVEVPLFTEDEQRILSLYERMEELGLEIALLKSQGTLSHDEPIDVSDEDIKSAEQELLKAKIAYQLRTNTIESVLVANPILKAVHAGTNAITAEQDLLPYLQQRDELSVTLTDLTSKVLTAKNELVKAETERILTSRQNIELTSQMIALAKDADTRKRDNISRKAQRELAEMDAELKISRQRWRIMKGTASGVIVGSGVDWARDPELLEIVLDDDKAEG